MWKTFIGDDIEKEEEIVFTDELDVVIDWELIDSTLKSFYKKYDQIIGRWIKDRPYVWIQNDIISECQRLYFFHPNEIVQNKVAVESIDEFDLEDDSQRKAYLQTLRKLKLKDAKFAFGKDEEFRLSAYSLRLGCEESVVSQFFRVYNDERDGVKYSEMDIRVEGERIFPKSLEEIYKAFDLENSLNIIL